MKTNEIIDLINKAAELSQDNKIKVTLYEIQGNTYPDKVTEKKYSYDIIRVSRLSTDVYKEYKDLSKQSLMENLKIELISLLGEHCDFIKSRLDEDSLWAKYSKEGSKKAEAIVKRAAPLLKQYPTWADVAADYVKYKK